MKPFLTALSVLALSGTAAFAGGPVVVAQDPVIMAPAPVAAYDWTGAYVGLAYGATSGSLDYTPGGSFDLNNGSGVSIFGGYLVQNGALVYGGELAYTKGSKTHAVGFPTENVSQMLDLKAKLGYATDRVLFYGILGYSSMKYDIPVLPDSFNTNGFNYGIGMDFAVTNQMTVGLEYLARNTSGDTFAPGQTADLDVNTISLRVAYRF